MRAPRAVVRDLPLFVKLLAPFLVLLLVTAAGGLYLVVRDLSSRAQATLDEELLRASLDARSRVHDRELYLLESVSFAANLRGMADAVRAGDARRVADLLRSVPALKTDLEIVAINAGDGASLAGFTRDTPGGPVQRARHRRWGEEAFVRLAFDASHDAAGLTRMRGAPLLSIAAPVCSGAQACEPVGVAVVGIRLRSLAAGATGPGQGAGVDRATVTLYDRDGRLLAADAPDRTRPAWRPVNDGSLVRRTERLGGQEVATLYAPLEVRGDTVGTLAVGVPAAGAFAAARGAALRLAVLLFAAVVGVVVIGALVSRWLLAQVRPLVHTSREFARGNLTARVPVMARDELGELAVVLNEMAGQLHASHATLERRVDERTAEVRRLLRERTELFAGISHELRTPIAVILSEAHMLIDPAFTGGRGATGEAAGTIIGSSEQLLARVNEILDLARAESGRLDVRLADVAVGPLLGALRPTAQALAAANGLTFEVDAPAGLPPVRADRSRLGDVLLNLVENAVKYTPAGGSVSVAAARHNGSVRMTVADTGIGIPPEAGERIFEPFYQVPGARPQHGAASSGLGLSLARRLVEAQGGTISYMSTPGAGTRFDVELPLANGAEPAAAHADRR